MLECYNSGSRNVFALGFVPLKDENTGGWRSRVGRSMCGAWLVGHPLLNFGAGRDAPAAACNWAAWLHPLASPPATFLSPAPDHSGAAGARHAGGCPRHQGIEH